MDRACLLFPQGYLSLSKQNKIYISKGGKAPFDRFCPLKCPPQVTSQTCYSSLHFAVILNRCTA